MPEWSDTWAPGSRGWWPNQSPLGAVPDTLIAGSNVVPIGPGFLGTFAGYASSSGTAADTMMPVASTSGGLGTGSVIYSRGDTYWFCGSGTVVVGSTSLGSATTSLQFRIGLAGANITAGIPVPAQPVLATNGVGSMTGTYSVKIAYKRSATGAIGNASVASASVSASSNALKLTGGTVPAGMDRVRVYSSARGFSTTGPWLFLSEHTVTPGAALNITALGPNANGQWADGDRGAELAPIENYAPSDLGITGTHVLALGSVMVIIGSTGGYAYSFPTKPETYSPERFATLPGPVVGVQPRAADGFAYVYGTNYLAALILTADGDVNPRVMWADIGFPNPDAACLVESELWGYTGEPVRTTQAGDPDTSFGLAVRDYMRANWSPASVVVGYSPEWDAVVYFHGAEAVAYFRSMDAWSTPLTGLSGVRACVTVGSQLRVAGSGGTLSAWGSGGGSSATATMAFRSPDPMRRSTLRTLRMAAKGAVRVDVLVNLDQSTSVANQTLAGVIDAHGACLHINYPNVISYSAKYTLSGSMLVYQTVMDGWLNESHV